MQAPKAALKNASPYQQDKLNLPVENLETAISFYETMLGFRVISQQDTPVKSAIIARDDIQIGLAEKGATPRRTAVSSRWMMWKKRMQN